MGRPPRQVPPISTPQTSLPSGQEMLDELGRVIAPLVRLSLACGVDNSQFAQALKPIFAQQAQAEIKRQGMKDTDSAVSLLSGLHRKDVREWRMNGLSSKVANELTVSSQVFTRWIQDPSYINRRKRPIPLKRLGDFPSFESLAKSVTVDVNPYTVLVDLMRLGLVTVVEQDGVEMVVPKDQSFVPADGSAELLTLFGGNLTDHARTAVSNMLGQERLLEQSVFAEGIGEESARELADLAQSLWVQVRTKMIAEATRLYEQDRQSESPRYRVRFGSYFSQDILPRTGNDDLDTAPKG